MSLPVVAQAAGLLRSRFPEFVIHEGPAPDRVEGTGSTVVEVLDGGPWGPVPNNARHRVLQINILSDRTRDADGLPLADDADARAWTVWEQVDDALNDHSGAWDWPHTSRRADGPTLTLIPDGDGSVMLSVRYEVSHD